MFKWINKKIQQAICYHDNFWYTFNLDWNTEVHVKKCKLCELIQTKFVKKEKNRVCHTGEHLLSECPGDHGK